MEIRIHGFFLLIYMIIFLTSGFAEARGGWAVIVGIDNYHSPEISRLLGASNDAKAMADTLHQVFAMPDAQILVYTSVRNSRNSGDSLFNYC